MPVPLFSCTQGSCNGTIPCQTSLYYSKIRRSPLHSHSSSFDSAEVWDSLTLTELKKWSDEEETRYLWMAVCSGVLKAHHSLKHGATELGNGIFFWFVPLFLTLPSATRSTKVIFTPRKENYRCIAWSVSGSMWLARVIGRGRRGRVIIARTEEQATRPSCIKLNKPNRIQIYPLPHPTGLDKPSTLLLHIYLPVWLQTSRMAHVLLMFCQPFLYILF